MRGMRSLALSRFRDRAGILPQARLAGPMPWVITIMTALTVIAAAAGLALSNLVGNARTEIAGGVTVQIVEAAPPARERQVGAALALLRARADVASVRLVPDAELRRLLEPWLGAEMRPDPQAMGGGGTIPIPALIDVRLDGGVSAAQLDALRSGLREVAPSARVDAHAGWLGPLFAALSSLQWLAAGLVALLATTSAAAVWLAARSALGSNRETIETIHLLGGTDGQLARLFQRSIGMDAAIGSVAGMGLGLAAILVLGRQFAALDSGMVAVGGLGAFDWAILLAIPVAGIALAMLTARITVLAALRRML